jgi:hypothetical protein
LFGYIEPPDPSRPFVPALSLLQAPSDPDASALLARLLEIRASVHYPAFDPHPDDFLNTFATQIQSSGLSWEGLRNHLIDSDTVKLSRCEWVVVRIPAASRDHVLTACFTVRDFRVLAFSVEKFISCSVFESGDAVWVVLMTSASSAAPRLPELTDDAGAWDEDD